LLSAGNPAESFSKNHGYQQQDRSLPENLNKRRILDYIKAGYSGDIERAATYYDDDIDFLAYAPIDVFPTLGQKRGKAAMVRSLVEMHAMYRLIQYQVISIVAEGDRVALMLDLRFFARKDDRIIRLQFGNFYTLRQGRIQVFRQFMDSFDAVQQKLRVDLIDQVSARV
jgi:uncharacterized protein